MAPKLSKSEVNYRKPENFAEHCSNCSMYKPQYRYDGECSLVKGLIYKYDVCDRWEANE